MMVPCNKTRPVLDVYIDPCYKLTCFFRAGEILNQNLNLMSIKRNYYRSTVF